MSLATILLTTAITIAAPISRETTNHFTMGIGRCSAQLEVLYDYELRNQYAAGIRTFECVKLRGAHGAAYFVDANLAGVHLLGVDASKADFTNTNFYNARIHGVFDGAILIM